MYSVHLVTSSPMNCTSVMLRNHYIVAVSINPLFQILIGFYYALLIVIESLLFSVLLGIHIKIRKCCHPFFGLLFSCVLFCYIVCGLTEAICQFSFLLGATDSLLESMYMFYDLCYSAITPLCFCCLIERAIATIWAISYELNRNWAPFLVSVVLTVAFYIYFGSFQCRGCFVSAIVTAIIIVGCVFLYILNRKWTLRYQRDVGFLFKVTLSLRYQIIENMIVVRKALLPVIILDSLVTLVDLFSAELTEKIIEENWNNTTCHSLIVFSPYILLNHVAMFLEYCIPLYVLITRKSYRRQLPQHFRCLLKTSSRVHQSHDSVIQNVFGRELNVIPTQNEYFAKLKDEWK